MKEEPKERWRVLCEQAAVENNPDKLLALITEINRLLDIEKGHAEERTTRNLQRTA